MSETLNWSAAQARLEVSYGMTQLGAQRMLEAAVRNTVAGDETVRVVLTGLYPERFEITDRHRARTGR
jgi:hypothetical protein